MEFLKRKPDVDFISPLSLEECEKRLFDIPDRQHRMHFLNERPVTRRISDIDFYLMRRSGFELNRSGFKDLSDIGLQPVLLCRLSPRPSNEAHVTGKLGFYSGWNRLVIIAIGIFLVPALCIAISLIFGRVEGSTDVAWMMMAIPLIGPLALVISYLHERTHLPYLTIYLRQVLLDPSIDLNQSQFASS